MIQMMTKMESIDREKNILCKSLRRESQGRVLGVPNKACQT